MNDLDNFLKLSLNEKLKELCDVYGPDVIIEELVNANRTFVEEVLDTMVREESEQLFDE